MGQGLLRVFIRPPRQKTNGVRPPSFVSARQLQISPVRHCFSTAIRRANSALLGRPPRAPVRSGFLRPARAAQARRTEPARSRCPKQVLCSSFNNCASTSALLPRDLFIAMPHVGYPLTSGKQSNGQSQRRQPGLFKHRHDLAFVL